MKSVFYFIISIVFALFSLGISNAQAACTSPDGGAGAITWNGTDSVIWCDGTNWNSLASGGGGSLSGGTSGYLGVWSGPTSLALSSTSAGNQLFWDGTNHHLGIGTATPGARLEVRDGMLMLTQTAVPYNGGNYSTGFPTTDGTGVRFASTGTSPVVTLQAANGTSDTANYLQGYIGSIGKWLVTAGGLFRVGDGSATYPALSFSADNNTGFFSPSPNYGGIAFSGNGTERLRIDGSGNVGIGNTMPGRTLEVTGTGLRSAAGVGYQSIVSIKSSTYSSESSAGIAIDDGTSDTGLLMGADAANDIAYIQSLDPGNSYTTRALTLNAMGGNVGIGTASPASLLSLSKVVAGGTYNDALSIDNPTNNGPGTGSSIVLNAISTKGVRLYSNIRNATPGNEATDFGIQNYKNGSWVDRIYVEDTGDVGIGTASPGYKLDVNGTIRATTYLYTSDRRLKTDVETVDGLNIVSRLHGVSFKWKDTGKKATGVIAQEIETVLPSAVSTDAKGIKSVDYLQVIGPMIEAIKELKADNDNLRAEIADIKRAVGEGH